ncbi:MAG: hypothetical protein ACYC0Z_08260, partial [Acidobacteriaceae bacterium]
MSDATFQSVMKPGGEHQLEYRKILYTVRSANPQRAKGETIRDRSHCVAFTSALTGEGVSYLVKNLAVEASRHITFRVAVLDMNLLLQRIASEGSASVFLSLKEGASHWTLAFNQEATGDEAAVFLGEVDIHHFVVESMERLLGQARRDFNFI